MLESVATAVSKLSLFDPNYWHGLWHFENMVVGPNRPPPFGVTTIMMCLFFGTNFLLFLYFLMVKNSKPVEPAALVAPDKKKEKELSKPFAGSLDCYSNITTELMRTGLIMALTYIAEYMWIFPHSSKSYSRDLFVFVLILFFAYAVYTIKPIHDLSLLGREQTEEWKGWMQFIFLLYHYFHAEEVYNSVRVMITCYVWMTGFGNFSFFYTKADFSWLRVVQMLWRLNFSVLLLMWTHGNTYILYYICPMHTFYFLMVYATMRVGSSVNTTKWGIRIKLLALALTIYLIWDINPHGLFDALFAWLGTDKVIGANSGSVWEYYFRTSLDHWSTLLGMIFALNFPLAEQYFKLAKGPSLTIGAVLMGALALYWGYFYFPLDKMEYNMTHSYMAIIPLTAYIFFRNITPAVRSGVSMSLHDLGKTTLETYLLQHHIWLSSNAKTLWTLTPGNPWINFALCTLVFFFASKELYRLTMTLRGMILPDDKAVAMRNGMGLVAIVMVCGAIAQLLFTMSAGMLEVALTCIALSAVGMFVINRFAPAADQPAYSANTFRFFKLLLAAVLVCLLLLSRSSSTSEGVPAAVSAGYKGSTPACLEAVSKGSWAITPCTETVTNSNDKSSTSISSSSNAVAYCMREQWAWEATADCPLRRYSSSSLQSIFKGKRVVFVGDSIVRSAYHGFLAAIDPLYEQNHSYVFKHQDMATVPSFSNTTSFAFRWAPFAANITTSLTASADASADMLVLGASLWDALYVRDLSAFKTSIEHVSSQLAKSNATKPVKVWLLPTTILDDRLLTDDKRAFMNERVIAGYREVIRKSTIRNGVHVLVDPQTASAVRESHSVDGVHYTEDVYQVVGQMLANAYALHFPSLQSKSSVKKPYVPKTTGAMSLPDYGAGMLVVIVIMLFLMDSFLGVGYISLLLGGKSYDWDAAYIPLHSRLGIAQPAASSGSGRTHADAETDGLLGDAQVGGQGGHNNA